MDSEDWTFPTLAYVWEYRNGAILAGADRLDALRGADRDRSLAELSERVEAFTSGLDDSWLVTTAFWMVEDIYKSFFRDFAWGPGVHDYIAATGQPVVNELRRRGFVLHYVVDATENAGDFATVLGYLPAVFRAAGFAVVGPQLVALELLMRTTGELPADISAIQSYRDEGHEIADAVISRWHEERQSSVYLNLDLDDDLPGLSLDIALSQSGMPGVVVILRDQPPAEGSEPPSLRHRA